MSNRLGIALIYAAAVASIVLLVAADGMLRALGLLLMSGVCFAQLLRYRNETGSFFADRPPR